MHYWFRRKRIGWGLEPANRAGWISTLLLIVVDAGGSFALTPFFARSRPELILAWAMGWLALFLAVAFVKAEPNWWKTWQP